MCLVKTVHSFLLNVTLLNSILYPNCSFVHMCLCSHFGWTNVCFFLLFSFLSPPFFLCVFFFFFWFWMWCHLAWLWLAPSLHDHRCRCRHCHCRCVDVTPLSTVPHPAAHTWSTIRHGAYPLVFTFIFVQNLCSAFFFSIFFSLSYFSFSPSLFLIAPGRVDRAPCHLR